jgi:hypothetical protein
MPGTDPSGARLRVVYVTSVSYSGSTLLDLLLSSHSRIASLGEAKGFSTGREDCTCAAGSIRRCPFWNRVDEGFRERLGIPLRAIRLDAADDAVFVDHNRALFDAVRAITGADVLVDSSKSLRRLARLLETDAFELRPIHLVRSAEGVAYSNLKKRHDWRIAAYRHGRRHREARRLLHGRDHRELRYETMAENPEATLRALMPWIGVDFEPAQLEFRAGERHNFGGNPMRLESGRTIAPDLEWQSGLGFWRRLAVPLISAIGGVSPLGGTRVAAGSRG